MSDRATGVAPSRLVAVLGPTNTGKTHLAVERMLGHASGMIGLPLRLLAREIYDRVVKARGKTRVALITGEEKIVPERAVYFVCTVEAMPLGREVEFLAVDEIQLCADPERGHVFTQRLLHARGKYETMLLGSGTMAPLIRQLLPQAEIVTRERFSTLTYDGPKKLTRLPRRSAIVAFSAEQVYAIGELIRRQRGGAAVVMGSLSPRTRNAQVALYQSGEVDFLVATDAIGMGLNMDVGHVAFAGLRKYDGKRLRWLHAPEIGQIAGRAGRYRTDGTFGVTGEAPEMDDDLVAAVENHAFDPVAACEWRNSHLDFQNLDALLRSLNAPAPREGLVRAQESVDEFSLKKLAQDETVRIRARDRTNLMRLWDVCQTPDFRKSTGEDHLRLVGTIYDHLTRRDRRLPEDWMAEQFAPLDRTGGDIDALQGRLTYVRTLAYIANRPDWVRDPVHWQERTRALEDRLSDTLHERLMARFVDRRTSVLLRSLGDREEMEAVVAGDGTVTVQGHFIGRLKGLAFEADRAAASLEEKALRAAAQRAVGPEVVRRLGLMAAEPDQAFSLTQDGLVLWRGEAAGALEPSRPFAPKVRLLGDLGPPAVRERAQRRLEAFLAAEAECRIGVLHRLEEEIAVGKLKGLSRGLAWRIVEAGGVIDRALVSRDVAALSQAERRTLKALGVRFGAFSLYLPPLLTKEALVFTRAFAAGAPPDRALAAQGLRAVGGWTLPVENLERLDAILHEQPAQHGGSLLPADAAERLGWPPAQLRGVLKALDYAPVRKPEPGKPSYWRRRKAEPREAAPTRPHSPFAALAALAAPPARRNRPRRRKARTA
ncbi:MAG TPA: helicase-related protein [Caulobacteraceae bacterium]|nr:helicase-related protein [Caulobacteraceae bacterium]